MNTKGETSSKWQLEELFEQAERIRAEMQRAEEWVRNRELRWEQCNRQRKMLEADGARKGKMAINQEIMRKVSVGIRIAKDSLYRRQKEMQQCLIKIRDELTEFQAKIAKIKKEELYNP